MVRYTIRNGCPPVETFQRKLLIGVHVIVTFISILEVVILAASSGLAEDSCTYKWNISCLIYTWWQKYTIYNEVCLMCVGVAPSSVAKSVISAFIQFLFLTINIFCLIWYHRLRHQLYDSYDGGSLKNRGSKLWSHSLGHQSGKHTNTFTTRLVSCLCHCTLLCPTLFYYNVGKIQTKAVSMITFTRWSRIWFILHCNLK